MKKIFLMMALAAMTLTVSAQDAELKTYDCKPFTCQYPAIDKIVASIKEK